MTLRETPHILLVLLDPVEMEEIKTTLEGKYQWVVETLEDTRELEIAIEAGQQSFHLVVVNQDAVSEAQMQRTQQWVFASMPAARVVLVNRGALVENPAGSQQLLVEAVLDALRHIRLRKISAALQTVRCWPEITETLFQGAYLLTGADDTALVCYEEQTGRMTRFTRPYERVCPHLFRDRQTILRLIREDKIVSIADLSSSEQIDPDFLCTEMRSLLGVPVPGQQGSSGMLFVFSRQPDFFNDQGKRDAVRMLAMHAGQAAAGQHAIEVEHDRTSFLSDLIHIGQDLTRTKNLDEQIVLVSNFARRQLGVDTFFIGIYDPPTRSLRFEICYDEGIQTGLPVISLEKDRSEWGITGYVAQMKQELIWMSREEGLETCALHHIQPQNNGKCCQTCLYLPLVSDDQTLGVMSIQSYTPNAFSDEKIDIFRALASQFSVSIENARLFDSEQYRSQVARTLSQSALSISTDLDPDNIFRKILVELQKVVPYDMASVQVYVPGGFKIVNGNGFACYDEIKDSFFALSADHPNSRVYETKKTVILKDAQAEYAVFRTPPYDRDNIHGWMGVPLIFTGQVIGMIALDKHLENFYTPEHADLAETFASLAAAMLSNGQLMTSMKEGRSYLQALQRATGRILAGTAPVEVVQAIVDSLCVETRVWRAAAMLLEEGKEPELLAQSGFDDNLQPAVTVRPNGISQRVLSTRQPWFADNIQEQSDRVNTGMIDQGVRSAACLPLLSSKESIGVLWIHYNTLHAFSPTERSGLELYANQSAIAYEHARLLQKAQQVRDEAYRVALSSSSRSLNDILKTIVQAAQHVLHCDITTLYVYDQDEDMFLFPPATLGVQDLDAVLALKKVSDRSVIRRILNYGRTYESIDPQHDDLLMLPENERINKDPFVIREDIRFSLCIPLRVRDRKVGVLFINYKEKIAFTQQDRANAELFASQAALAIHNAQIYGKLNRSEQIMEAMQDINTAMSTQLSLYQMSKAVSDSLSSESLSSDSMLRLIAEQAYQLTGYTGQRAYFSHISLVEDGKLVRKVIYPPEREVELGYQMVEVSLDPSGEVGITGRAVLDKKTMLVEDVSESADYLKYDPRTRSELVVPIFIGDSVYGVIDVEHHQENAFGQDDVVAMQMLASQAAGAIQYVRLLEQIRESQDYIKALYSASSAVLFSDQTENVYSAIVHSVKEVSKAWRVILYRIDAQTRMQQVLAQEGFTWQDEITQTIRPDGVSFQVMSDQQPYYNENVLFGDARVHPLTVQRGARSVACLPLLTADHRSIGVMWLHFDHPHQFSNFERSALQIHAYHSAMAIENARRYNELKETQTKLAGRTVLAWTGMVSSTWFHSVEKLALAINAECKMIGYLLPDKLEKRDQILYRIENIKKIAKEIRMKPITPPLSAEEGVLPVKINELVSERIKQLAESEDFRAVEMLSDYRLAEEDSARISPEWIRRALDILIQNAHKATAGCEHPVIKTTTRRSLYDPGLIEICVLDNGIGIPPEVRKTLFEEPAEKKAGEEGLGIGLLMVSMILQTYGGSIRVNDEVTRGTEMIMTLPLYQVS